MWMNFLSSLDTKFVEICERSSFMETTDVINSLKTTDIINCLVGIIGLITSIIAIWISICSARRQYKIELFNKRITYYYACDIICACCITGMEDIVEKRFENMGIYCNYYDVVGTQFLFKKETSDFISLIFSKWVFYRDVAYFLKNYNSNNCEEKELYEEMKKISDETIQFFHQAREELLEHFEQYLKLSK